MRICSAAQLHTAPLSQTPAPLAPTCDCVLSLLGPRNNSLGVRVAVHLSGKSPEVKYRHCRYGPSGGICCVRGLKTTLEWKIKKNPSRFLTALQGFLPQPQGYPWHVFSPASSASSPSKDGSSSAAYLVLALWNTLIQKTPPWPHNNTSHTLI